MPPNGGRSLPFHRSFLRSRYGRSLGILGCAHRFCPARPLPYDRHRQLPAMVGLFMSLVKAQFVADFSKEMLFALVACAALAALWAGFRPDMVRDNDGRRLPPSVSARLTFMLLFVVGYLSITAVLHFLPYF